MTKKIVSIIMLLFCTAGAVVWGEDDAMLGFLRETEGHIAELLQKGIEGNLEKRMNVRGVGQELAQHIANARFVPVAETEFRQYSFAVNKPFNYAYASNSGAFIVNRDALTKMILLQREASLLRTESAKLISDLARGSGELMACMMMGDFKQYWHLASGSAGVRPNSQRHAYDMDGRVNPVAIFGVYIEYLLQKQIPQEGRIESLHDFAMNLASAEPEYTVLAQEMKTHYPEDDFALLQMLGYEASWSAIWAKGMQCIKRLPDTDAKSSERQVKRLNKLIRKLAESKIPEAQKNYIQTKYSISQLNELAAGKVHFESPEEAVEKERAIAEDKRRQRVGRLCGMYADYLNLLKEDEVWYIESTADERMVKLVATLQLELASDLVDQFVELLGILDSIHDTDSAEAKIPQLVHHLLRMRELARLREAMAMESTFGKMMDSRKDKMLFIDREYAADILHIHHKALNTLSQIMEKMRKQEYYNSDKLAALLQPLNFISSGSAYMGPNSELWYETRRALENLQLQYLFVGAPERVSIPR